MVEAQGVLEDIVREAVDVEAQQRRARPVEAAVALGLEPGGHRPHVREVADAPARA